MAITKEEVKEIAEEAITVCRREVDKELIHLHEQDKENAWTEERARELAAEAAKIAVKNITDQFYLSVGKKTVTAIGVLVVAAVIFVREQLLAAFNRGGQ